MNNKIRLIIYLFILSISILIFGCKCSNEIPQPTPPSVEDDSNSNLRRITIDSTKIITYDSDTHLNSCESCRQSLIQQGWYVIKIEESNLLFDAIKLSGNKKINTLVIVSHSTIGRFNTYFNMGSVCEFANTLREYLSDTAKVYLNGCNTGIESYSSYSNYCVGLSSAQRLVNLLGSNITVYGSKGFLQGSFPEQNERCDRCKGTECYGVDATLADVWSICKPNTDNCVCWQAVKVEPKDYNLFMLDKNEKASFVKKSVEDVRPFPDVTIALYLPNSPKQILDIYILERVVYNRNKSTIYQLPNNEFSKLLNYIRNNSKPLSQKSYLKLIK